MILRTTFENIYSFNEETSISFVAGKGSTHASHVSRAKKRDDISALKFGVLYGANASGKSNAIKALSILQQIAIGHFPKGKFEPFKLGDTIRPISKVEVEFKTAGHYFAYGVEFSHLGISEEWLYEVNSRTDKLIFERTNHSGTNDYKFGDISGDAQTAQFIRFISAGTPNDVSFLSEYIKRNGTGLSMLATAYRWFANGLCIIFPDTRYRGISFSAEQDEEFHNRTRELLELFNTGIIDVRRYPVSSKEETNLPESVLTEVLDNPTAGRTTVVASADAKEWYFFEFKDDGTYSILKQKAVHLNSTKDEVVFEMGLESDGSIRLLDFIPMLIDLQHNEKDYVIDELDRSMHPLLSLKIVQQYLSKLNEDIDTQLIISTHECNLLDLKLLRSDEVWFIEKNRANASEPVSLAEYKPREDVQKGYLQGRYGAIPFFADIKILTEQP